jgi:hypothetical protein
MRGKLSDQDLTNYALNDGLDSRERLYVESLLAVSEECRQDVYTMIEMGQMLDEGFDCESDRAAATLTLEQRARLVLPVRHYNPWAFAQKIAATIALSALVALGLTSPRFGHAVASSGKIAQVTKGVSQMVQSAVSSGQDVDFASFVDLHFDDDTSSWMQTANDTLTQSATICTPPSWPESDFGSLR